MPHIYETDGGTIYRQSFATIRAEAELARLHRAVTAMQSAIDDLAGVSDELLLGQIAGGFRHFDFHGEPEELRFPCLADVDQ